MKTYEISCRYGGGTKSTCFVCENRNGSFWYVVKGGTIVNKTYDYLPDNVNVECLSDIDCFTVNKPINTINQFEKSLT